MSPFWILTPVDSIMSGVISDQSLTLSEMSMMTPGPTRNSSG